MRFSQLAALNDPFEFLVDVDQEALGKTFAEISEDAWEEQTAPDAIRAKLMSRLLDRIRLEPSLWNKHQLLPSAQKRLIETQLKRLIDAEAPPLIAQARRQFDLLSPHITDMFAEQARTIPASIVIIFSCAENASSVPMWAHYGSGHSGFQIGFDHSRMFDLVSPKGRPIAPRKVRYDDRTPTLGGSVLEMADFVTQKMKDWEYEREWRYVWTAPKDAKVDDVHLFDFNIDAIKEVTLGLNASDRLEMQIRSDLATIGHACPLFRVRRGTHYGFEREELDPIRATRSAS